MGSVDGARREVLSDLAPVGAQDGKTNAADAWVANGILNGTIKGDKAAVSSVDALLQASVALMGLEGGERVTYLHEDALGTVTVWTDADGLVIDRAEPYPYGEPRYESGGYVENYWFAGQERDSLPGLSYHSARYLDTRTGRWLSADPLKLSDPSVALKNPFDQNVFGYVRNNPINLLDPLGLEEQEQQNRSVWQTASNAWEGFKDWVVGGVGLGDTMKRSAEQMQGALGHQAQMRQIEGMESVSTVDHERNTLIKRKGDELVGDSLTLGRNAAISKGASVGVGLVAGSLKTLGKGAARQLGKLRSIGSDIWESSGGLVYGPDKILGNRVQHVLAHTAPDASKPMHSVFSVGRDQVLALIDEAWGMRGAALPKDPGAFVVPMGRTVGTAGETAVKIVVKPGTNRIVTAYPVVP